MFMVRALDICNFMNSYMTNNNHKDVTHMWLIANCQSLDRQTHHQVSMIIQQAIKVLYKPLFSILNAIQTFTHRC